MKGTGVLSVALAAVGAVVGAVSTFLLGRRNSSGSVLTSNAQQLWDESTAFRHVQNDRILELSAQVARMQTDRQAQDDYITLLRGKVDTLYAQADQLRGTT